jgi:hypothetical protein
MSSLWLTSTLAPTNRLIVVSLYRQLLRELSKDSLPISLLARASRKAELRAFFDAGSQEASVHNVHKLLDTGRYVLEQLRQGKVPSGQRPFF